MLLKLIRSKCSERIGDYDKQKVYEMYTISYF